jgi:hypothetical protein
MRLPHPSTALLLTAAGCAFLGATVTLTVSKTPIGSPLFFAMIGLAGAAYVVTLHRVWSAPSAPRSWLFVAFAFAVAFRGPLALSPVGPDNDMVRYLWDGRIQRLGYNPYYVVPADPAMAATHTAETRQMPSRRARTPYPPAAQLFFRLVSMVHDSTLAMKLALVGCDLLTAVVLWRWLVVTGRNEWLALAYAWNPLVVLEVSHSGHIDALGALWITAAAYWVARRRDTLAAVAFVFAVGTKLLPIVLAPLLLRRVRVRNVVVGVAAAAALCLPFVDGRTMPLGALPNVVAHIRFNGPAFKAIAGATTPLIAAAAAVLLGTAVALWARLHLAPDDPAGWAWPMGLALACAPVVYPWYLLYFTPFLFSTATIPLLAWTFSVLPVYLVWQMARNGGRWAVPPWVMVLEYGAIVIAAVVVSIRRWRGRRERTATRGATTAEVN